MVWDLKLFNYILGQNIPFFPQTKITKMICVCLYWTPLVAQQAADFFTPVTRICVLCLYCGVWGFPHRLFCRPCLPFTADHLIPVVLGFSRACIPQGVSLLPQCLDFQHSSSSTGEGMWMGWNRTYLLKGTVTGKRKINRKCSHPHCEGRAVGGGMYCNMSQLQYGLSCFITANAICSNHSLLI